MRVESEEDKEKENKSVYELYVKMIKDGEKGPCQSRVFPSH